MSDFLLKKWYLDAADERGNVYIGYLVSLHWRQLELHGYHHLWRTPADGIQTQGGLVQQPSPVWENQARLSWHPHTLSATWDSLADGLHETVLATEQGEITWHCTQPKGRGHIQLPQLSFIG